MAEVARIVVGDLLSARRRCRGEALVAEELADVAALAGEGAAGLVAEQFAVFAQRAAAAGGVVDHEVDRREGFDVRAREGRAEWSYVQLGAGTEREVEITSGIDSGDTVLTDGHMTLAHGAPIQVSLDAAR